MKKASAALMAGLMTVAAAGFALAPAPASADTGCRTYSSVEACGTVKLTPAQQACVTGSTAKGMTENRAAVECHAFA